MDRHWTRVIRRAAMDASWKDDVGPAIENALARDIKLAIADARLKKLFDPERPTLFNPAALLPRNTGNPLIDGLPDHLALREAEGLRGRDLLLQALGDNVREELDAKKREMLAHVMQRHPMSAPELSARFNSGRAAGVVERAIGAALGEQEGTALAGLDLDGDLLGGMR